MTIVLLQTIKQNLIMSILDLVINNIKNEMKRQNIKQHEFAEKMGYGHVHMSNMLRQKKGGADSLTFIEKAAKVFNISATKLLMTNEIAEQYIRLYDLKGNISDIAFRADWLNQFGQGEFFLERMQDEAMLPTIKSGDLILIKKMASLSQNGIYIFRHNENISVRRVTIQLNNQIIVNTDSNLIPQVIMQKKELDITLLGKVIWLSRSI